MSRQARLSYFFLVVIVALIVLFGLAFGYNLPPEPPKKPDAAGGQSPELLVATPSPSPSPPAVSSPPPAQPRPSGRLIVARRQETKTAVVTIDVSSNQETLIFSDEHESQKIQSLSPILKDQNSGLVLFSSPTSAGDLYGVALDGSRKKTKISEDVFSGVPPVLSPDRQKIAMINFNNAEDQFGFEISWQNLDGSGRKVVATSSIGFTSMKFSVDGRYLVVAEDLGESGGEVKAFDLGDQKIVSLYKTGSSILGFDWLGTGPLVVVIAPTEKNNANQAEIYSVENGQATQLTENAHGEAFPVLSPDQKAVAFIDLVYPGGIAAPDTDGTVTIYDFSTKQTKIFSQATQILGWQP